MHERKLPVVRSHERIDFKRCNKKWYWKWRKGLVPKEISFGALELGTWVHEALALWYSNPGHRREGVLRLHFVAIAEAALWAAKQAGAPDHALEKAEELIALGEAMCHAYESKYGIDPGVFVIQAEIPLEFTISDNTGMVVAVHRLKPDLVFSDEQGGVWLMEHKTAASIRTGHLVIDDQARPYGAMAGPALRKLGLIRSDANFKGILYNFLRKALPDDRPRDGKGRALNRNGSVSKRQPPVNFQRVPVRMTRKAKLRTLHRVQSETVLITEMTRGLREGRLTADGLPKTPHNSCPRTCQFWALCVAEEEGSDITSMEREMFVRRDPYVYAEDSTDEIVGFEMG